MQRPYSMRSILLATKSSNNIYMFLFIYANQVDGIKHSSAFQNPRARQFGSSIVHDTTKWSNG